MLQCMLYTSRYVNNTFFPCCVVSEKMIASDCLDGVPLLMLANKQDLEVNTIFTHWGNGIEKNLECLAFY